jgi:hypothetical protein
LITDIRARDSSMPRRSTLYFNVFAAIIRALQKLPFLHAFAPARSVAPPHVVAQLVFAMCVGVMAVIRFHPTFKPAS